MATVLTLRKANTLQKVIQEQMTGIAINPTVDINEFQDLDQTLAKAAQDLLAADMRRSDLLMALYTIRTLVGAANAQSGIASKLSHAAYIDKRLAQLEQMVVKTALMTDVTVIRGQLEKIRSRPADSRASLYGHHDDVTTGVLTEEQINSVRTVIADLRKQKQKANDEILELNVSTTVQLTPEVEAVLQREGII